MYTSHVCTLSSAHYAHHRYDNAHTDTHIIVIITHSFNVLVSLCALVCSVYTNTFTLYKLCCVLHV